MGALSLENFEDVISGSAAAEAQQDAADPEIVRIGGFEKGYQAGWDDALQSEETASQRLDEELGRNLEELSFSFFEAQRHVSLSLEPLVRTMVEKVLPELLKDHFGLIVSEMVEPLVAETANLNAELVCAPSDLDTIGAALAKHTALPLTITAEPSFARHQVRLQLGHEVHEMDGDKLVADIRASVDAYFSQLQDTAAHAS